jgi:uncharacterized protein (DUF302 family)
MPRGEVRKACHLIVMGLPVMKPASAAKRGNTQQELAMPRVTCPTFTHSVAFLAIVALLGLSQPASAEFVRKESPFPVKVTIDRLETILKERGFTIFARVDHAAGAKTVNLELRPTELLIFGNPQGGTPMMLAEQTMGASLPLRALAWLDASGKVWLGYDAIVDLATSRGLSKDHPAVMRTGEALKALTDAAVKP